MGHIFKYRGDKKSIENLWKNKESIDLYIARLKEFWDEENQCWIENRKPPCESGREVISKESKRDEIIQRKV